MTSLRVVIAIDQYYIFTGIRFIQSQTNCILHKCNDECLGIKLKIENACYVRPLWNSPENI